MCRGNQLDNTCHHSSDMGHSVNKRKNLKDNYTKCSLMWDRNLLLLEEWRNKLRVMEITILSQAVGDSRKEGLSNEKHFKERI